MITSGVIYAIAWSVYLVGFVASFSADDGGTPAFFALMPILWLVQAAVLGFSIMAAVRASQGVWWRYPISIRFVSGGRPKTESL